MKHQVIVVVMVIAVLFIGAFVALDNQKGKTEPVDTSPNDEVMVRTVVSALGTKLQMVPLLASTEVRREAMEQNYGAYVAPELLALWFPEGTEALGRYTSNPRPGSIDIVEVKQDGERYIVEANVIEVTEAGKEVAAVYPVTLTLEKRGENWMIVEMQKGAYSEVPHSQTIVGYWECLPVKDTTGPQTLECAFGIAVDQSDGHFAVNTMLMSQYPVDFPTGTKVRVFGVVTPTNQLSSIQKYDIDGIINATVIEKVE